jgi:hypothetical protein
MTSAKALSPGVVKMLSQAAQRKPQCQSADAGVARVKPTPEQMRRAHYEPQSAKTHKGQVTSSAYRRRPLFETLAKGKSGIDADGLRALRFYRDRYEGTAKSLTRPPGLDADYIVKRCDAEMGAVADTMRAVALEDQSFSEVAIARFGSRTQSWIEQEKVRGRTKKGGKLRFVEKIVPKSGRHR